MTQCFHGGASFDAIGADFSDMDRIDQIVRADVTDAPYGCAIDVTRKIQNNLGWLIKNSPPTNADGLVKVISRVRGVSEENLLVGGGSSDLMYSLIPNLSFDAALILDPMYGEYAHIVKNILRKTVRRIRLSPENDFSVDINNVIKSARKKDLVILVNPNNPTGRHVAKEYMIKLLESIPSSAKLLVDEAYIDYVSKDESLETLTTQHENLIVLKSMSKYYALSGLRVGYASMHQSLAEEIRPHIPPWSVNMLGQMAGIEALKAEDFYAEMASVTRELREDMAKKIAADRNFKAFPSSTNFFLVRVPGGVSGKSLISGMEIKYGIYLRDATTFGNRLDDSYLRISVKDKKTNKFIVEALQKEVYC